MPRYFTVEEARASLPLVRTLMEEAQGLKQRADELQTRLTQSAASTLGNGHRSGNGSHSARGELESLVDQLRAAIARIEATGCIVKDLDAGLADWPHLREGREVYLCWLVGEPDIEYWHEIETGFRGRQAL